MGEKEGRGADGCWVGKGLSAAPILEDEQFWFLESLHLPFPLARSYSPSGSHSGIFCDTPSPSFVPSTHLLIPLPLLSSHSIAVRIVWHPRGPRFFEGSCVILISVSNVWHDARHTVRAQCLWNRCHTNNS